jgi:hypothetical protein
VCCIVDPQWIVARQPHPRPVVPLTERRQAIDSFPFRRYAIDVIEPV